VKVDHSDRQIRIMAAQERLERRREERQLQIIATPEPSER
jgi:hypothetical protein